MRVELVDCANTILREIAMPKMKRRGVAMTYAFCLKSSEQVEYLYEEQGFNLGGLRYLPDFWLPQVCMYAEVKPRWPEGTEMEKIYRLSEASGFPILILDGLPALTSYWTIRRLEPDDGGAPIDEWVDVVIGEGHAYHLSENRFFSGTGKRFPDREAQDAAFCPALAKAVRMSWGARFEHGENGGACA